MPGASQKYFLLTIFFLGILLITAGCAKKRIAPGPDRTGKTSPVSKGTFKPYKVYGEKYYPLTSARGYVEEGIASWYGKDFHGKKTASGEIYNMYALTAAHKILPMHTKIRVTNLANGKSVILRVNDRGPFVGNRIVDLSYAGAKALDMLGPGTAKVRLEALSRASQEFAEGNYYIQVGSFQNQDNAVRLVKDLRGRGFGQSRIQGTIIGGIRYWRVLAGKFHGLSAARKVRARMADEFPSCFILAD